MTLPPPLAPLAQYRQWVRFRLVPSETKPGKMEKLPVNPITGHKCSTTDPTAWTDYQTAADSPHGDGLGFVFTDADPFWFLDLDNCFPGGIVSPVAADMYACLPGAAWEVSQSGAGLHAFGTGVYPDGLKTRNKAYGVELYRKERFVALTGRLWVEHGSAAAHVPGIWSVAERYLEPQMPGDGAALDEWTTGPAEGYDPALADDAVLLERASKARTAAASFGGGWTFRQLWDAVDIAEDKRSEADAALAAHLAFWTGKDCERIERLMRSSALARDKWDTHRTYLYTTIVKACGVVQKIATPKQPPAPLPTSVTEGPRGPRTLQLSSDQLSDKSNHLTIECWITAVGGAPWYDEFSDEIRLGEHAISDHEERELWLRCREQAMLKFPKELFQDVLYDMAWRARRNPLREYLAEVEQEWDGVPRLDGWLTAYMGVAPSAYSAAIGAIFLTAAVRRVREPGCKFDEMIVLESPEGFSKSTAVMMLCERPEWFTDELRIGMTSKELLEVTQGKWIVEAPEMVTARHTEAEHMKAMLSRGRDRARLAYARHVTERGRQWVALGSTNQDVYLTSRTGNRRVWPVKVETIDLAAIKRDRRQLWAEACRRESAGASIRLPDHLWAAAREQQDARVVFDVMQDEVSDLLQGLEGRVRGATLLKALGIPVDRRQGQATRLGDAMRALGWENKPVKIHGRTVRCFIKGGEAREILWVGGKLDYAAPAIGAVA